MRKIYVFRNLNILLFHNVLNIKGFENHEKCVFFTPNQWLVSNNVCF